MWAEIAAVAWGIGFIAKAEQAFQQRGLFKPTVGFDSIGDGKSPDNSRNACQKIAADVKDGCCGF